MSYYSDAVIRDGAVAYWRLGETSGNTAYDSIGSNHGTISGGVTLGQSGALADGNKAISFNGTGDVAVPKAAYSDFGTGPVSIEFWIKIPGNPSTFPYIFNCKTGEGLDGYLSPGQVPVVRAWNGGSPIGSVSTLALTDGGWHHIIAVVRRAAQDTIQMYCDGTLVGGGSGTQNLTVTGANLTSASQLHIGSAGTDYFPGLLDDFSIYHVALTSSQVKTHYTLGLLKQFPAGSYADNVIRDGAVAYWRLGETSGTTAVDIIGGNNGTISGGVTLGQSGALVDGNKAMLFNGTTGNIRVPTGSYQAFGTNPFSLEVWIYPSVVPTSTGVIIDMKNDGQIQPGPAIYFDSVNLSVQVMNVAGNYAYTAVPNASLIGKWSHIVVSYERNPDRANLYVNGAFVNAGTPPETINATTTLGLGVSVDSSGSVFYFNGYIDDISIYHIALTPAQVANHHAVSKYATPFGESVGAGLVMNLVAGKIYSLPPRLVHITASAPVEVSVDGVTFTALTQEVTGASYIRTLEASCSLVAKPVRPIAIGA